jgi:hypothetical protein
MKTRFLAFFVPVFFCLFSVQSVKSETHPLGMLKLVQFPTENNIKLTEPASDSIPYGLWKVTQVTVERNTGNKIDTIRYSTIDSVKDRISFPQALEVIDRKIMMLTYSGLEEKRTAGYTIDGNRLLITVGAVAHTYFFSMKEGKLILTMEQSFANSRSNQSAGQAALVSEKWIFLFNKQD